MVIQQLTRSRTNMCLAVKRIPIKGVTAMRHSYPLQTTIFQARHTAILLSSCWTNDAGGTICLQVKTSKIVSAQHRGWSASWCSYIFVGADHQQRDQRARCRGMSQRSIDARLEISAGNQEAVTLLRRITNCDSRPASAGTVLVSTVNSCSTVPRLLGYAMRLHFILGNTHQSLIRSPQPITESWDWWCTKGKGKVNRKDIKFQH